MSYEVVAVVVSVSVLEHNRIINNLDFCSNV